MPDDVIKLFRDTYQTNLTDQQILLNLSKPEGFRKAFQTSLSDDEIKKKMSSYIKDWQASTRKEAKAGEQGVAGQLLTGTLPGVLSLGGMLPVPRSLEAEGAPGVRPDEMTAFPEMGRRLATNVRHPLEFAQNLVKGVAEAQVGQVVRAGKSVIKSPGTALPQAQLATVPLVGPAMGEAVERFESKEPGQMYEAGGDILGLAASFAIPKMSVEGRAALVDLEKGANATALQRLVGLSEKDVKISRQRGTPSPGRVVATNLRSIFSSNLKSLANKLDVANEAINDYRQKIGVAAKEAGVTVDLSNVESYLKAKVKSLYKTAPSEAALINKLTDAYASVKNLAGGNFKAVPYEAAEAVSKFLKDQSKYQAGSIDKYRVASRQARQFVTKAVDKEIPGYAKAGKLQDAYIRTLDAVNNIVDKIDVGKARPLTGMQRYIRHATIWSAAGMVSDALFFGGSHVAYGLAMPFADAFLTAWRSTPGVTGRIALMRLLSDAVESNGIKIAPRTGASRGNYRPRTPPTSTEGGPQPSAPMPRPPRTPRAAPPVDASIGAASATPATTPASPATATETKPTRLSTKSDAAVDMLVESFLNTGEKPPIALAKGTKVVGTGSDFVGTILDRSHIFPDGYQVRLADGKIIDVTPDAVEPAMPAQRLPTNTKVVGVHGSFSGDGYVVGRSQVFENGYRVRLPGGDIVDVAGDAVQRKHGTGEPGRKSANAERQAALRERGKVTQPRAPEKMSVAGNPEAQVIVIDAARRAFRDRLGDPGVKAWRELEDLKRTEAWDNDTYIEALTEKFEEMVAKEAKTPHEER